MLEEPIFIDQLSKLVECITLPGDMEENAKALDMVVGWLDKKTIIRRVKNGKAEILIAGNTDSMRPDFAYMVHMDVVV